MPSTSGVGYQCKTNGCQYSLAVTTASPCRFALLQTTDVDVSHTTAVAALPVALADGVPTTARSDVNGSRVFAITVPNKDLELLLTLAQPLAHLAVLDGLYTMPFFCKGGTCAESLERWPGVHEALA